MTLKPWQTVLFQGIRRLSGRRRRRVYRVELRDARLCHGVAIAAGDGTPAAPCIANRYSIIRKVKRRMSMFIRLWIAMQATDQIPFCYPIGYQYHNDQQQMRKQHKNETRVRKTFFFFRFSCSVATTIHHLSSSTTYCFRHHLTTLLPPSRYVGEL
jgi:hypothetical protein